MIAHTPEDFALAKELYAVAIAASYPGLKMKFEALNGNQMDGWIAVAQHVKASVNKGGDQASSVDRAAAEKGGAS
jgi:hypothetical protein